jgi:hypothetical protein
MERLTILAPNGWIDDVAVRTSLEQMDSRDHSSETLAIPRPSRFVVCWRRRMEQESRGEDPGIERKTLYRKLERMGL